MNQGAGNLQNLRDIVEPARVSWWPLAPGWWFLIIAAVATALMIAIRLIRRWRANAYRRAALRELQSARTPLAVATLLKRTALCAWPRGDVAALSGTAWCEWLERTGPGPLSDSIIRHLSSGIFRDDSDADNLAELSTFARDWIRRHRHSEGL